MATKDMVKEVDEEIARLHQIRALLLGGDTSAVNGTSGKRGPKKKVGRPAKKGRRVLSPEARERIAAAQRKRWAASKKAAKKISK